MSVLSGDVCELFNLVTSIRVIRLRAWASGHMDVWAGVFLKEGRAVQRQEHLLWLWNSKESVSLEGIEWGVSCRRWGQRALEANVRLSLWVWWGPKEEIKQGGDRLHLWPSPVPLAALWGIELKGMRKETGRPSRGHCHIPRRNEYAWPAGSGGVGEKWLDSRCLLR